MAGTQVVPFAEAPVPAHVAAFLAENSNIDPKINIDSLSVRGKVFRIVVNGEEKALLNADDEPVTAINVVVLAHNKAKSRSYFEGAYEEGKSTPPICWSTDGVTPDAEVENKQAKNCAACARSVKGSKTTPTGKATTECTPFKRIVLVPMPKTNPETDELGLDHPPLRLQLAQTSVWDGKNEVNEAKGYYAWDQYIDMLRKKGAMHTGIIATRIKFDANAAYPKLLFAASRWLVDEEIAVVKPLFKAEEVLAMLKPSVAVPASTVADDADDDAEPVPPPKKAKAAAPPEDDDADDTPPPPPKKAKAAAPPPEDDDAPPPPPKKVKAAAPPPADDDEDAAPPPPPKKAKAVAAIDVDDTTPAPVKGKAKANGKGAGLNDLVAEWDDVPA